MPGFKIPTPIANAESKSEAGSTPAAKKRMLPPLQDLVALESAPKRAAAARLPLVADLNICIYKVGGRSPLLCCVFT